MPGRRRDSGLRRAPWLEDAGFTLVELTVVVAVLGVLLAFGIATFTGAADKAAGRAVEVELRDALLSALVMAQEAGGPFLVGDQPMAPADLQAAEPALTFGESGSEDVIGVAVSADAQVLRLDKVDREGTRHTLVADGGRGLRLCAGGAPAECELPTATATTTVVDAETTDASDDERDRSAGRQDGNTPAAERRRNGGR